MARRAEGGAFAAGVVWPSLLSETREAEPRGREGAARSHPATGMLSSRPCAPGPSKGPGPRAPQGRSRAGPGLCPDAQAALVLSCGLVRRRTQPGLPAVSPPPLHFTQQRPAGVSRSAATRAAGGEARRGARGSLVSPESGAPSTAGRGLVVPPLTKEAGRGEVGTLSQGHAARKS